MTTRRSDTPFDLCKFRFTDGRYCSLPAVSSLNGYCRNHGAQKTAPRPPVEHNELIHLEPFSSESPTPEDIRIALASVFRALASNRISTKRAAAFAYLGQVLLAKQDPEPITGDAQSRVLIHLLKMAYPQNGIKSNFVSSEFPPKSTLVDSACDLLSTRPSRARIAAAPSDKES